MLWKKRTYLDYASATPVRRVAARAHARAQLAFGNPASPHEEGRRARDILEVARTTIARLVEVKADDVIFTSGATEANNLAIRGLVHPGSHVLYLPSAHSSVVESVHSLEGVVAEQVPVQDGLIDINALSQLIRPATALITLDAVCGETGTVWDTRAVRMSLEKLGAKRPLLHVDASQAPSTQKISRAHFGADLVTFDAQKVGGVRGIGALIGHRTLSLHPLMFGGGQERGLRPGTPAPALAAAFAAALTEVVGERERFVKSASASRQAVIPLVSGIRDIFINEGREVAPNILNLSLLNRDTDYLVALLEVAGFAISTRSACEGQSTEGSRAVFALTGDRARAFSTLRISWGSGVSKLELLRFARALVFAVAFVDKHAPKSHY